MSSNVQYVLSLCQQGATAICPNDLFVFHFAGSLLRFYACATSWTWRVRDACLYMEIMHAALAQSCLLGPVHELQCLNA